MSATIQVFDPAMCCSTGICGPSVDPQLVRFAADLDWLKNQGVSVTRFNLSQEPGAFAQDADVKAALEAKGEAGLPLLKIDGEVKSSGVYPSRQELMAWVGLASDTTSLFTPAVAELVAIGAAIAANCEPCFKFHYDKARKLGVSRADMLAAVTTAQAVKDAPAKAMLDLADRYLRRETGSEATAAAAAAVAASDCCSPESSAESDCCAPAESEVSTCCEPAAPAASDCCSPAPGTKSSCC